MDLKTLAKKIKKQNRLVSGHRTCAGCGIPSILRTVMAACDDELVIASATCCAEVTTTIYPYTSWNVPWVHNTFENVAATLSGVETAYKNLKRQGKIKKKIKFLAMAGDGGTYDIGLQSLSGALERGHDFVYLCYDNEGYMNTGGQRSSATPMGAHTTTTPVGDASDGKTKIRKDIMKIVAAHNIPYVAQAAMHDWQDLYNKAKKAFETPGPAFINVFSPCTMNWKFDSSMTPDVSRLAVETGFWPIYEIENGVYKINYKPKKLKEVNEFLASQGRFKHLLKKDKEGIIDSIQKEIHRRWKELNKLESSSD